MSVNKESKPIQKIVSLTANTVDLIDTDAPPPNVCGKKIPLPNKKKKNNKNARRKPTKKNYISKIID